ncbi:cardiolipin synthase [Neobacillus massiliamazoniensis]|uniref:Cardiolipin synthase n=1 Tax=Neobacillus massiliamazoniensis TaxID=1499688 RepID=A0A0U1NRN1_9BACI|nr:cardiolipin synthase [Neobacillus massiliamazoniensis]CRK80408.1 cardiolipin synthetase [Neobacillus massiliamazoniensis]
MEISFVITPILILCGIINILLAVVIVFFERRDIGSTWAWLIVLLFIPVGGFLMYLFLGRQLKQKNFFNLCSEERGYFNSDVNVQIHQLMSCQFYHNDILKKYSELLLMNLRSNNAFITTNNEITIFRNGQEKFDSLFHDIRMAKKEINIQYYIIQRDSLGKKLRDTLTQKTREGVKVRVLYDEIGSKWISPSFFHELISNGGEVAAFFPSFLKLINFRINNRNHRKLCIIDSKIAYIGGFNVGNEYLGLNKKLGNWRDTHFKVRGEAVNHIEGRFILDWNHATKQKLKPKQFLIHSELHEGRSPVQIVASGPNSETEHIKNMFIKLILSANKSVYIQTPYFVPDTSFMDACKMALLAGVDLRIMIPDKADAPFVYWASWAYVGELLKYGAKILLYKNGFMHAKTMVVDQEVATVGTANIDTRSFRLNFEVNAIVYDQKVAKQLYDLFIQDGKVSLELTMERYCKRSIPIKCKEAVSRLLSPIL